jgi:serine/threonine protein kinase
MGTTASANAHASQTSVKSMGTTADEDSSSASPPHSVRMSSLHSNLMRSQNGRDPLDIYEVLEVLGEGSMGSVSRVRKKDSALGGSARDAFVLSSRSRKCCFLGWCLPGLKHKFDDAATRASSHGSWEDDDKSFKSSTRSVPHPEKLGRQGSSLITHGHKDVHYALKSIHLDRCSNHTFIDELKNEGSCVLVVT